VVIIADDTNPPEVPSILYTLVNTLVHHGSTVISIESSLVVGLLGVPFQTGNSPEARRELVDALLRESGNRI
jgi:hypothetical protein